MTPGGNSSGGALIAAGAMIVFLSGACTAGLTTLTLPASLFGSGADLYALVVLIPTLIGGGVFFAGGAALFWQGHAAIKAERGDSQAKAVERIGYWATLVAGSLFGAVCLTLSVRLAVEALRHGDGSGVAGMLGLGVVMGLTPAIWAFRRLRALRAAPKDSP